MKLLNFKKIILTFSALIVLIFSFNSYATDCEYSGSAISDGTNKDGYKQKPTSTNRSTDCFTTPDLQRVIIYKVYLCTDKPGDPTSSSPINLSSCGDPVFESANGAEVDIEKGSVRLLTNGEFKKPANGKYRYVYLEISPTMKVKVTKTFQSIRKGSDGSSGLVCWSINSSNYDARSRDNNSTKCGAAADGSLGLSTNITNTLDGIDPANRIIYQKNFITSQKTTLSAFILNSSNQIASGASDSGYGDPGTIAKIVGYAPQDVEINDSTSQIIVNYNNYEGTNISQYWNGTDADIRVNNFSGGPFDLFITAQ
jgi:hypothetical protein